MLKIIRNVRHEREREKRGAGTIVAEIFDRVEHCHIGSRIASGSWNYVGKSGGSKPGGKGGIVSEKGEKGASRERKERTPLPGGEGSGEEVRDMQLVRCREGGREVEGKG